jgi:coenzyme F420-reducing hydrogenase delta subunit/Pyruvate/2-oxoacid:ferredoxin oxidoreductase delta subunit
MFSPAYDECQLLEIEADNVIFAIGQGADMNGFTGTSLEVDQRGRIKWNPATLQTNIENVFACGEVVTGPGSAVAAMKNAHHAATAIENYLTTGKVAPLTIPSPATIGKVPEGAREAITKKEKNSVPMMGAVERVKSFVEAEPGFSVETAMYEASRCMNCGRGAKLVPNKCVSCLTCVRVCPYGAPFIGNRLADFNWDICQSCGICMAECPQMAIDVAFNEDILTNEQIDAGTSGVTVFGCQYAVPSVKNPVSMATPTPPGVNVVKLMCNSRLDMQHILRAIENGVDGVAVLACTDEKCRHRKDVNWAEIRANRVRKVLDDIGIGAERVRFMGAPGGPEEFGKAMAEFKAALDEMGPNPLSGNSLAAAGPAVVAGAGAGSVSSIKSESGEGSK